MENNCSRHKSHIEHYPNHKELAEAIGDLRYDSLIELFAELAKKFEKDADADNRRGRTRLSDKLGEIHFGFIKQTAAMEGAWEICKPYMETKNNK